MQDGIASGCSHATPQLRFLPRIRGFVDLIGLRFANAQNAAEFGLIAADHGLDPGPLHRVADYHKAKVHQRRRDQFAPGEPACIRTSLGPVWDHPEQLREVLAAATDLGGKVYRLDLAADVLGVPADAAASLYFPSIGRQRLDTSADAVRLRRRSRRLLDGTRPKPKPQRWRELHGCKTRYTGTEDWAVSAAVYTDSSSKLEPDGPPVLHFEIRAHDMRVPEVVRCSPLGVLHLADSETFWRTFATFTEAGNPLSVIRRERVTLATLRMDLVLALVADESGFCSEPVTRLAELAKVSVRQAKRALSALSESELAPVVSPGGGRSHTAKRLVRHAFRSRGMVCAQRSLEKPNRSSARTRSGRKSSR